MKILIIDDTQTEVERAVAAVEAAGHEAILATWYQDALPLIPTVDAVLTDLFFNPLVYSYKRAADYEDAPPASGLLIAMSAVALGKPVAICTDGDHHSTEISWIYDGYVGAFRFSKQNCPFHWNDEKDWAAALKLLDL